MNVSVSTRKRLGSRVARVTAHTLRRADGRGIVEDRQEQGSITQVSSSQSSRSRKGMVVGGTRRRDLDRQAKVPRDPGDHGCLLDARDQAQTAATLGTRQHGKPTGARHFPATKSRRTPLTWNGMNVTVWKLPLPVGTELLVGEFATATGSAPPTVLRWSKGTHIDQYAFEPCTPLECLG